MFGKSPQLFSLNKGQNPNNDELKNIFKNLSFHNHGDYFSEFLNQNIDDQSMTYDEQIKFKVAKLRLSIEALKEAGRKCAYDQLLSEISEQFNQLFVFLGSGVPKESLIFTQKCLQLILEFYYEQVIALSLYESRLVDTILKIVPNDYRARLLQFYYRYDRSTNQYKFRTQSTTGSFENIDRCYLPGFSN